MGVALLGWSLVVKSGSNDLARMLRADPELIFPHVVSAFIPPGLTGIVFAGLMAAALSTVSSYLNAGGSFLVRDVYQRWLRPRAGAREITFANYGSVLLLVLLAVLFSKTFRNANDIWTWLMAGWGGAKFVPMLMFWYWHRGNGTGFAVGSLCGLTAALWQRFYFQEASPMAQFAISSIPSAIGFCLGAVLTRPVEADVLATFYAKTRPWGFWAPIKARFTAESLAPMRREHRRDVVSVLMAVPWLLSLYLSALLAMTHQWGRLGITFAVFTVLSWGLYRWWFRWLGEVTPSLVLKPLDPALVEKTSS
jgi:Na+/proline symporter